MKSCLFYDFFTIDEFCEYLDNGDINAYDGFGYYSFGENKSDRSSDYVHFYSDIVRRVASKKGYTGVHWCNK